MSNENMKEFVFDKENLEIYKQMVREATENAVKQIEGVENVVADYKAGTVKITTIESLDENLIKEKIEDIGFEVKD